MVARYMSEHILPEVVRAQFAQQLLRSVACHDCCEVSDPRIQRVRNAYLEPFTTHAPRGELIAMADVAPLVGAVAAPSRL